MKIQVNFFMMVQCLVVLLQLNSLFAMQVPIEWEKRNKESRIKEVLQVLQTEGFGRAEEFLVNPNVADLEGNDVLLWIIDRFKWNKDTERILGTLIEAGADINFINHKNGDTPLLASLKAGEDTLAEWLMERGADTNVQTKNGVTVDKLIEHFQEPARKNLHALIAKMRVKQHGAIDAKLLNDSDYHFSAEVLNKINQPLLKTDSLIPNESSHPFKFSLTELPIHISLEVKTGPYAGGKYGLEITDSFLREVQWSEGEKIDVTRPIIMHLAWNLADKNYYPLFRIDQKIATITTPQWKLSPAQVALRLKELREKRKAAIEEPKESAAAPLKSTLPASLQLESRGVGIPVPPRPVAPAPKWAPQHLKEEIVKAPGRPVIPAPKWVPPHKP